MWHTETKIAISNGFCVANRTAPRTIVDGNLTGKRMSFREFGARIYALKKANRLTSAQFGVRKQLIFDFRDFNFFSKLKPLSWCRR